MAKKLDIAKLAERLNQLNTNNGGGGSGLDFISIKDGRNVVRVLPGKGDADFAEEVWVHYGVGKTKDNAKGTMVVCPTTLGDHHKCPVCELSKQFYSLSKKKDDSYSKQAKGIMRKKRVYFNGIDRGENLSKYEQREEDGKLVWYDKETDEKSAPVKVLGTGIGVYKDILGLICDPEYGDVTDAEEGLDLIITKSGSGRFNTNYDVKTVRKESPIGFDQWEECLHDLKQLSKVKTYDEIAAIMTGEEATSDDSDESEDDHTSNDTGSDNAVDDATDGATNDALEDEIKQALAARRKNK